MLCSGSAGVLVIAGPILALLYLSQIVFVPLAARRSGRDPGVWFFIALIWLTLNAGAGWLLLLIPFSALGGRPDPGLMVGFAIAAVFLFLPLFVASRPRPGHSAPPRERYVRRSSLTRRRVARRYR
jgi:hypothetical protein